MNKEDLGKYFIKDDVVYEAIGYTDNPTMELINRKTGNRISVVIGSNYANEFVLVPEDTSKEDKKIEKLNIGTIVDDELQGLIKSINLCNKDIQDKLNKIIDRINDEDNE